MNSFVWLHGFQEKIRNIGRLGNVKLLNFYHSPFFYLLLYLFLYGFHCLWNWEECMRINRNLEMRAANSGKEISILSLYPFQIFSVLLVAVFYFIVSFSINFLFARGIKTKLTYSSNLKSFLKKLTQQFFFFVCLLFIGNQFLGFFLDTKFYSFLVVMFWTGLFLVFLIKNGELYKRLFVSEDRFILFLSHSLGYLNPILFVFFVLAMANV